jgi:riboflavin kinase/FMN adenylyltransferase
LRVYHSLDDFIKVPQAVVTIGTFDGVHYGHQKIISRLKESAENIQGETVIFTFFPHPRMVLKPDDDSIKLLNTINEKIELISKSGIDHLIIHPFTPEFSRLDYTTFVKEILVNKIGVKKMVIGYDHQFGRNREGSFEQLKQLAPQYNFTVEEIPEQDIDNVAVSSTKIRHALEIGEVSKAAMYLGHDYSITGEVVKGDQIGRTIGYPTANIVLKEKYKLVPADGVYAVQVMHNKHLYDGMLSIGVRPTIAEGLKKTIEVNIFDFDKDIYGQNITIYFVERIRAEEKLNGLDALKAKLAEDKTFTINCLKQRI